MITSRLQDNDIAQLKKRSKVWHSNNQMEPILIQNLGLKLKCSTEVSICIESWARDCLAGVQIHIITTSATPLSYCLQIIKCKTKVDLDTIHLSTGKHKLQAMHQRRHSEGTVGVHSHCQANRVFTAEGSRFLLLNSTSLIRSPKEYKTFTIGLGARKSLF